VASIVGLGRAAELAMHAIRSSDEVENLRDKLQSGIQELIPEAEVNGPQDCRLPNTLSVTLPDIRGESLVVAMDQQGISLSSGSACKSGSPKPTHVLMAMGRSEREAHCTVRLSLSRDTTEEDIDRTLAALAQVLEEMETTVRFLPCK
jgi:cysteine sulfinate desulfinase/cysteine desulfurase-like protein